MSLQLLFSSSVNEINMFNFEMPISILLFSPRLLEMLNIYSVCAVGRVHGLSFAVVFSHNLKLL